MQKDNIQRPAKGLHLDSSPQDQSKDTYRFALNAVNETELGDTNFLSNEESNELCDYITEGFIPLGKIYISNNETVILSVSEDDAISEIGILDDNCTYTPHVNDKDSSEEDKLGFKVEHQIQGFYRLRRGCERTIYFTDDNKRPRYFNFDSPEDFKNEDDTWNGSLFSLQKTYSKIPNFQDIEVLDTGGNLEAGGYNIAIQYVDESLNPTEWITTSPLIKIYNDLSNKEYREINGSVNSDTDYINFPTTSKAIRVEFSNLDPDFLYYRLAFIESTSGTGQITGVKITDVIPTSKDFFIYTGSNAVAEGTEAEILFFSDIIERAKTITHLENRLKLGNTQGKQVNFCKLQKYASRIKADCITKLVSLNDVNLDKSNPKNPAHEFAGLGYMPGEIYSFGIVYIFEDGTLSPVYHIPGKNPDVDENMVFSSGDNIYPMSQENEISSTYDDNDNCSNSGYLDNSGYWGRDSEGTQLKGKPIRHHRFPLRSKINVPLVQDNLDETNPVEVPYYKLVLTVSGDLKTPVPCEESNPDCGTDEVYDFSVKVTYEVDGEEYTFTENVDPNYYASTESSYVVDIVENSQFHGSSNIEVTKIEVSDINGDFQDVPFSIGADPSETNATYTNSNYFNGNATISTQRDLHIGTLQSRAYYTQILGIKFSGIDLPSDNDLNGEKIVGYYIVRNERTEFDKTILDSAVLTPSVVNERYISHGLLMPETNRISEDVYGLIHPEHKFNSREYFGYDEIIQEGEFQSVDKKYGKFTYNDVYDGSSYDGGDKQRDDNDDGHSADGEPRTRGYDGWCLDVISRDNIVSYKSKNTFNLINDENQKDIKERFYLSALESKTINDNANDVYNITTDNKIGIIQTEGNIINIPSNTLPYVVLKKKNLAAYSNFRTLPYYKQTVNPREFDVLNNPNGEICSVFAGDTYVSPMRYVNTMYYDNRVAERAGRRGLLKIILGAVLAVVGAVVGAILVATGIGAAAGTLIIGAGIAVIGGAALVINSGLKMENYNRAYEDEYNKGLRKTSLDNWVDTFYNYKSNVGDYFPTAWAGQTQHSGNHAKSGPSDDSIQWIGDCITDLWFETSVNTNLRCHMAIGDSPTFLNAPGRIESGNNEGIDLWEYFGKYYATSNQERYPLSSFERHLAKKLLAFDNERNDNRYYIGVALGEFYFINPDYARGNKQKIYTHLPLEYDCCSECKEDFPHRWYWSEQSFQEELSDNFRVFLPNNYRDIPGETGEITNMFSIGNDLFIHTEEALWMQPRNYQERVTDQIVSFIGTGSYGEVPPRKVLDDKTGMSAGLQHQWSALNTKHGYFFVSENEGKIYQFDGRSLRDISSQGLTNWFRENTELLCDRNYYNSNREKYLYADNPSNPFGTGFISVYDSKKERVIFTKKDFAFREGVIDGDVAISICNGQVVQFPNYSQIIAAKKAQGWTFVGIEDCRMKFEKTVLETVEEEREVTIEIPPDTIVIPFFDTASMTATTIQNISDTIDSWFPGFKASVNDGDNNITLLNPGTWNRWGTEDWLEVPQIALNNVGANQEVLLLVFVDETNGPGTYHGGNLTNPMSVVTTGYINDVNNFVNNIYPQFESFKAINYPIQRNTNECKEYLQHAIAAIEATNLTQAEVDSLNQNSNFTNAEWDIVKNNLMNNPYVGQPILKDYGWLYKEDRVDGVDNNGTSECPVDGVSVLTPCQFTIDIEELLQNSISTEIITVEVVHEITEVEYEDGEVVDDAIEHNNSWTMSYALDTSNRKSSWVSWHSYLPNFYFNTVNKFYSWIYGNNGLWKHNRKGHYQTFYGQYYPHIIEYVSLSTPLVTRIWDYLRLLTEAKRFVPQYNEYVDERFKTFNKAILYNSRQCSGVLDLIVKDTESNQQNYLSEQVLNLNNNSSIIDRTERDWLLNDFRDIRVDYNKPIWNSNIYSVQNEYFIDKILNYNTMDTNKDWTQLESFRDKYLAVRLIFNNFADIKLITNYSVENEQQSLY